MFPAHRYGGRRSCGDRWWEKFVGLRVAGAGGERCRDGWSGHDERRGGLGWWWWWDEGQPRLHGIGRWHLKKKNLRKPCNAEGYRGACWDDAFVLGNLVVRGGGKVLKFDRQAKRPDYDACVCLRFPRRLSVAKTSSSLRQLPPNTQVCCTLMSK